MEILSCISEVYDPTWLGGLMIPMNIISFEYDNLNQMGIIEILHILEIDQIASVLKSMLW